MYGSDGICTATIAGLLQYFAAQFVIHHGENEDYHSGCRADSRQGKGRLRGTIAASAPEDATSKKGQKSCDCTKWGTNNETGHGVAATVAGSAGDAYKDFGNESAAGIPAERGTNQGRDTRYKIDHF
ncbi:hypothetical protein F183_A26620 [Bryobacterales bacterium F-183]|nr:hypothetical protein F183_A26620 [Bryobacterales bacterium F-183]